MKLRFPFPLQQLLSAVAGALLLGSGAIAQDTILMNTGAVQQGTVLGVTPSGQIEFQVAGSTNKLGLALSQVREVRMNPPAEYAQAIAAYGAKDYAKALTLTKGLVDKFKGMPTPWAQQAVALIGELYIQTNDLPKAEAAYNDFKRLYPAGGSLQSEVGLSRLAVAKKDYATAKQKLDPITDAALKEKIVTPANALAYSQAFLVSGQVKEAEGNLAGALEDYLRTVTLFYHDRTAVASAQERADTLRKAHKEVTVP
jgi:predicted Zn-dependent protease